MSENLKKFLDEMDSDKSSIKDDEDVVDQLDPQIPNIVKVNLAARMSKKITTTAQGSTSWKRKFFYYFFLQFS